MIKAILQGLYDFIGESTIIDNIAYSKFHKFMDGKMGYARHPRFAMISTPSSSPLPLIHQPEVAKAKVELHQARRAGDHLDLRINCRGTIYDFALVRRTTFPGKGEKCLVVRTPNHSMYYFEKDSYEFAPGTYGEGKMNTIWRGEIDIINANGNNIEFYIPDGDAKGRYAIRETGQGLLLIRMKEPVLEHRERSKFVDNPKKREQSYDSADTIAEMKYDGANYTLIPGEKENLLISRRLSVTGDPINRADHIPQLKYMKFPKDYHGRRIHVEVVAHGGNSSDTSGILNSLPTRGRRTQIETGKPLVLYVWDIEGDGSYSSRRAEYKQFASLSPRVDNRQWGDNSDRLLWKRCTNPKLIQFAVSNEEMGMTPYEYAQYVKSEGFEGVVLKNKNGLYYQDTWVKDKKSQMFDLKIIGFVEGTGKYKGSLGAIQVQDPETGAISKVGTGFTDAQRQKYWNYQSLLKNEMVEVECHEVTHKGVLRGPRFEKLVEPDKFEEKIRIKEASYNKWKQSNGK